MKNTTKRELARTLYEKMLNEDMINTADVPEDRQHMLCGIFEDMFMKTLEDFTLVYTTAIVEDK